jgi:cation transport ATPase
MIEDYLSWVKESASKSTYKLGIGFQRCEDKGEKSAPKFIPSSNYHKKEEALKPTKTHYSSIPKPSFTRKREVKRESPSRERKLLFSCFVAVLVTWMSSTFGIRDLRGGALSMLETHIVMSSLIFHLILTLMLLLALIHALFLSSLMDPTIAHMFLGHERTALSLDALVTTHILIVVIVSCISLVFLQEGFTLILSRDTWTVHVFPSVVLVPLVQTVKCKRL